MVRFIKGLVQKMDMRIRKKEIGGRWYYYLEETLRLEKSRVFSVFLGQMIPARNELKKYERALTGKIYLLLLGKAERIYLAKEEVMEAEKARRKYTERTGRMSRGQIEDKEEIDSVNFVYTTLTTEGVPITKQDAGLAYKFSQGEAREVRDENLKISLDMMKGLRKVRESKKGISAVFIKDLHKMIMAEYAQKNPGIFRKKQAHIYLKTYEKAEEIGFKPSAPEKIEGEIEKLTKWYNSSLGRLNAIELGALLHLRLYKIHPFEDGNKRICRLLLNKAFADAGYPLLNISADTQGYFDALVKSVEKGEEKPFAEFVLEKFIQSCRRKKLT